jgi:peptide/nickel transport system substrate-binding protein
VRIFFNRSAITKMQAAIIAIVIIVAAIAAATYYVTLPAPTPAFVERDLRIGFAYPNHIDPAVGNDECSTTSLCNLYDPLVYPDPSGGVLPWVASSWVTSSDGLQYNFTIRTDIKFHSGNTLTAEDVAFSMRRLLTIGQGVAYLFTPYVTNAVASGNVAAFTLNTTFGPFLTSLVRLYIVEKAQVMANLVKPGAYGVDFGDYATAWLTTHDAGSGAYTVVDASVSQWFKYNLVSNYWNTVDPLAPTNVTQLWTTGSSTTEVNEMESRELEVTDSWLSAENLATLGQVTNITDVSWPQTSEYYFMLNTKDPPLDDVHVRRALAFATPYSAIMSQIYARYNLATSSVPYGVGGYANTQIYSNNATAAQAELKLSKYYPDIVNNPSNYPIYFHWIADVPEREKDALLFASAVNNATGLNVQLVKTFWTLVVQEMANENTTAHIYNILVDSDYPEAGALLTSRYMSAGTGSWKQGEWLQNSTIDTMIQDALSTVNTTERFIKYGNIQKQIMAICPSIFIYDIRITVAIQNYVKIPNVVNPAQAQTIMGYDRVYRLWKIESH